MWIRSMMLMFVVGCVGVGDTAEDQAAAVMENTTVPFQCLNHTSLHIVVCQGSISAFPITVTVDYLYILSDNDLHILDGDLNDLAILDGNILDYNEILDDVEVTVLVDFLDKFHVTVTKNDIAACTDAAGVQVCK
jgi:hypothetical protein